MSNLHNRLTRLEDAAGAGDAIDVILRTIVDPGKLATEIDRIGFVGDARPHWTRLAEETEGQFIERAKTNALASRENRPVEIVGWAEE